MLGGEQYGDLGLGPRARAIRTPTLVPNLPCGSLALMAGAFSAVTSDGRAYGWGRARGQTPPLDGAGPIGTGILAVVGARSFFASRADGQVLAWGYNEHGQLGDGSTEPRWAPVTITVP